MRKIILSMMTTVDGYIEGTEHDINWHNWDDEMSRYMMGFFNTVDTFIYGRVSYELMISYWPKESGEFAEIMNNTPKLVYSRTLEKATWNASLKREVNPEEIYELKQQAGKDLVLFAGADIASAFIRHKLIDEYRIIVNPVVLGKGTPLFKNIKQELNLKLIESRSFNCGNVLLRYNPVE